MIPQLDLLHIETTTGCNLRCRHCATRHPDYVSAYLSSDVFHKLLPAIAEHKPWVNLSGHGETLIHPDFLRMFRACGQQHARGIEFQTNGHKLTPELISELLAAGSWERLKVSIDGATEETYQWVRGVPLKPVRDNLAEFRCQRGGLTTPGLTIEFCAMRRNICELPDVVMLAADLGADRIVVGDLREYAGMEGQSLVGDWQLAEKFYRDAATVASQRGIDFCPSELILSRLGRLAPVPKADGNGVCRIPWKTAFVDVAGRVRPCCVVDESLGDLNSQSFEEAWNGERANEFRNRFENGELPLICQTCTWAGRER